MAVQCGRRMDKEVHPSALQKTRHVGFSQHVRVREFVGEQHPTTFFKIGQVAPNTRKDSRLSGRSKIGHQSIEQVPAAKHSQQNDHASSKTETLNGSLIKRLSFDTALSASAQSLDTDSSTPLCGGQDCNKHSLLLIGTSSDSGDSCYTASTEEGAHWEEESEFSLEIESRAESLEEKEFEAESELEIIMSDAYLEKDCKLKEESSLEASKKAESFKIKWTFKRKKKKRQRLKVPQRSRKLLFLGDMNTGKSSLITTYCKDRFSEQYCPTILHFCSSDAKVMGRKIDLILADTSGRDDFLPLRQCSYYKTDMAILCYSASDKNTLERIKSYWLPELKRHAPNCPFVIAETKKDLREELEDKKLALKREGATQSPEYLKVCRELDERVVVPEEAIRLSKELGAEAFISTSACYRVGTRKLLQTATLLAVKKSRRKRLT